MSDVLYQSAQVLLMCLVVGLALGIGWATSNALKRMHVCRFVASGVENLTENRRNARDEVYGTAPVTFILYRCTCGKVKQTQINGHWSLAQVRGEP